MARRSTLRTIAMPSGRRLRAWPPFLLALGIAGAGASIAYDRLARPANSAIRPVSRPGPWMKQHRGFVEVAAKGEIDLLFLGDSITAGWQLSAPDVWARHYAPRRAANFGIGGDQIQNLLWRVDHGEVDGIAPKVVVVLIGTNNLGNNTEGEIVEGIAAVVARLRVKLPDSKLLLVGLLPRGVLHDPSQASTAPDPRVPPINARLAGLGQLFDLTFLDVGPSFLDAARQIPRALMPDFLHLSRLGYQTWADAMEPRLWELMGPE